jgi:hypothetical protein
MARNDEMPLGTRLLVRAIDVIGDVLKNAINRKIQDSADRTNESIHRMFEDVRRESRRRKE